MKPITTLEAFSSTSMTFFRNLVEFILPQDLNNSIIVEINKDYLVHYFQKLYSFIIKRYELIT